MLPTALLIPRDRRGFALTRRPRGTSLAVVSSAGSPGRPVLFEDPPPIGLSATPARLLAGRARATFAFIALAAGLTLARDGPALPGWAWFGAAAAILALAAKVAMKLRAGRASGALLTLGVLLIGAGVQAGHRAGPRADDLRTRVGFAGAENAPPVRVIGVLLEDPRPVLRTPAQPVRTLAGFLPGPDRDAALFRVEAIVTESGWARTAERLRLSLPPGPQEDDQRLRAGDRLAIAARLVLTGPPTNPGQPDPRERAGALAGSLTVPDPQLITRLSTPLDPARPERGPPGGEPPSFSPGGPAVVAGPLLAFSSGGPGQPPGPSVSAGPGVVDDGPLDRANRWMLRLRAELRDRAGSILGPPPGRAEAPRPGRTLLADLLLGQDNPADPGLSQAFTRLGLAHVLAISGFHLVVLAAVSMALIRLTGDRGPAEALITALAVAVYLVIVPSSAPVLRSGFMVLTLLAAEAVSRRYDRLTLLCWTACILLLFQPDDLRSLGFQLSYGLTALLLWLGERFHLAMFGVRLKGTIDRGPRGPAGWLLEGAKRLTSTSVLCWMVAAPLIAWHTGQFSPLAVISTLLITPVIIALLWCGFAGLLIGLAWPGVAAALAPALLSAGDLAARLVHGLDGLPGTSLQVPAFSLGLAAAATGVLLYLVRFGHRRDAVAWGLACAVAAWGAVELAGPGRASKLDDGVALRIDALDAGRGSCAIVRTPEAALLWDCGSSRAAFGRLDFPRAARSLGVGRIETVIISHADLLHFSAVVEAAEWPGLRRVLVTPALPDRARAEPQGPAALLLRLVAERGIEVRAIAAGDEVDLGSARLRVLSPPAENTWLGDDLRSLVAVVEPKAGGPGIVLTGQLADDAVERLVKGGELPRGSVVYLAARGSGRALREMLIEVEPRAIIASNAEPIVFGEVWGGEAPVLQTSVDGAVRAELGVSGGVRAGPSRSP